MTMSNGFMRTALLAGALSFLALGHVSAQSYSFSGQVVDSRDQTPLQYAVVGFPELRAWGLSDENGDFEISLSESGTYTFLVIKRGFYFVNTPISLSGEASIVAELDPEDEDNPVGPGRLMGRVLDVDGGGPMGGVRVSVIPTGQETTTDRLGRFLISDIAAGAVGLVFERDGYETRTDTVASFPGVSVALEVRLSREAIELPGLTVEVYPRFLEATGFYRRAERGGGYRYARQALDDRDPLDLADMFHNVPGVREERQNMSVVLTASDRGRGRCTLGVYLDGMRVPGFDLASFPASAVQAIELYTNLDVPFEYNHSCGVVLIWSRRG